MRRRKRAESSANLSLLEEIRSLKSEHPFWGCRRIWAYLRYRKGQAFNIKRIYRLMKTHKLLVPKNSKLLATRSSKTSKPRTLRPDDYWGTDMTKIMLPGFGWCYLHLVIDWGSKKLVGHHLSERSKTSDWLVALDRAVNQQFPNGIHAVERKPSLVSDHGCQPTSVEFMKSCAQLGIEQIFASYGNPKGNADTERVIRTIKEDLIWVREFNSFCELEKAIDEWIRKYNTDFPHSALGYWTPYQYERWFKRVA